MSDWIQAKDETICEDRDAVIRRLSAETARLRAKVTLNEAEVALVIEALAVAASHRLSLAAATPSARAKHGAASQAMDELRERIVSEGRTK